MIKRFFVFDILPMVFRELVGWDEQTDCIYECMEKMTLFVLLPKTFLFRLHGVQDLMPVYAVPRYACFFAPIHIHASQVTYFM